MPSESSILIPATDAKFGTEKTQFGSSLSINDQLYLDLAIRRLDEETARLYIARAGLPCAAYLGNDFSAVIHTARMNQKNATDKARAESSDWLARHGYPAPVLNQG